MPEDSTPDPDAPVAQQPDSQPDRLAQPVDAEQPPRLPFPVVGVGASAGGIEAFAELLAAARPGGGVAYVFVLHLPPDAESHLAEVLGPHTAMPVRQVENGTAVEPDHVYVIRPGHVLTIREGRLRLGPALGTPRAANRPVDEFFRSLAEEQRERAVCVVLSGMGSNGAAGAQAVKAVGGLCVAQDPESAQYPSMPRHLIDAGYADFILRPADIPDVLLGFTGSPYAAGGREADADELLGREGQHLREILAVLRTRTRQDFAGYKKQTVLRRVQRRMGLTRAASLAEYAKLLRQTPAEVTALADDLLIHVTGFFRDPDAWDALRRKVVVPLVAERRPGEGVRAWVAACSSGEEAYSLAILLTEEAERANKPLDIKVFATDLADRTLAHARAGVYPGGIESEVSPERLARFFTREAEVYRVKADLRDRVVFAPQNVLSDPPFSRLDVATCRNLLIYLEPGVQRRVLHLLHFGLREGGALFLGTSETVAGAEGLFESLDKKARIYRRVGPTRHGAVDFPLPTALPAAEGRPAPPDLPPARRRRADGPPASVAELTRQALLDAHTPPAVTVDRDGQVVYYHGDPGPYLHLAGEPTRDLLLLAREGVRGATRAALHRAAADNAPAVEPDGWADWGPGRRSRVAVTASPVPADPAAGGGAPAYFVVSFGERGDLPLPTAGSPAGGDGAWDAEVRRLRGELQSTIEELQTSNEELKASNEEVMSVNEELQSANEELETSKEEMQSLNEELTTVNSQLRAKMEEHQAASSDLTSLLASTDIAVLFLDTTFHIRRFTPAVRDLLDLIPADVGRPLAALARQFDDPHLDADCGAVLERLVPVAREVRAASGRHYLRRVLPYRTTDNRIDGVVVTFVDITDRKRAEESLAAEKEYAESIVETLHEPLLVLNPDLTVKTVNPAFYTHFRVNPAETVGRRVYHLGNGQWDIPALRTLLEEVLPDSNVFNDYEVTHEFEGLGRRVMLVNGRRLDHVQLILLGIRDVTERARAEDALRASEEQFRRAIEDAPIPVIMQAEDGQVLQVSKTWTELTGYALADVPTAEAWLTLAYGPGANAVRTHMRELFQGERQTLDVDFAIRTRGGADRHWSFSASAPGTLLDGRRFLVGMAVDVTDRRAAETRQAFLLALSDALGPLGDAEAIQLAAARVLGRHLGASRVAYAEDCGDGDSFDVRRNYVDGVPEATGRSRYADFGSDVRSELESGRTRVQPDIRTDGRLGGAEKQALAGYGVGASLDVPLVKGGRLVAFLGVNYPTAHDFPPQEVELVREVAERTWAAVERARAEESLRASEERLRLALVAARMGTWTLDLASDTQTRDANLNRLLGLDPAETTGPFAEFLAHVHPDDRAAVREAFDAVAAGGRQLALEFRVVWPDGTVRWLRDQGDVSPLAGRSGPRMAGACVDVTDRRAAEESLRASEERLRLIVEGATDYAIFTLAPDRTVTSWTPGAATAFGFATDEMVGRPGDLVFTPEDRAAGAPEREAETALREGRAANERWHVRRNGARFYASGVLTPLGAAGSLGFVKVLRDLTDRKRMEDSLREARDRLEQRVLERTAELNGALESLEAEMARRRVLARRLSTAQEDERKRVSRDLHDSVGQLLAGLSLAFKAVETSGSLPPAAAAKLAEAQRVVGELGKEVHALAVRLRPTSLDDLGLEAALGQLVAEWSGRGGVPADFQAVGLGRGRLPAEVETAVYRVVEEALTNVTRHARATRAGVVVTARDGRVTVAVEDDGTGFDPAAATDRLGLLGMRERVALVGGVLDVESSPGAGTTVIATIPVPPAGEERGP